MLGGRGTCLPREFGLEHLDGDLALVLEVVREVHGRHTAGTEFAVDAVAVGQGGGGAGQGVAHLANPFTVATQTSLWKSLRVK